MAFPHHTCSLHFDGTCTKSYTSPAIKKVFNMMMCNYKNFSHHKEPHGSSTTFSTLALPNHKENLQCTQHSASDTCSTCSTSYSFSEKVFCHTIRKQQFTEVIKTRSLSAMLKLNAATSFKNFNLKYVFPTFNYSAKTCDWTVIVLVQILSSVFNPQSIFPT